MRETILLKAIDLYLTYGVKSVTMDDISKELSISKKTIYLYFANKRKLVEAASYHVFEKINQGIKDICRKNYNPIEELFIVKTWIMKLLKSEQSSPQFQLQKYYPQIFEDLKKNQLKSVQNCISENIKRGIEQGLYIEDLDIPFITRLYFIGIFGIKNEDIFPREEYNIPYLFDRFLEYHLRSISTEKGRKQLEKTLKI